MRRPFDLACQQDLAVQGYHVRPALAADDDGLCALYGRHRWNEFALLDLPDTQIRDLLVMQYRIQRQQYLATYGNTRVYTLDRDGDIVGRLMLGEADGALRILDILIAPDQRGRGIGGAILAGLLHQAGEAGWPVTLHVAKGNPAGRLYQRLGFRVTGDMGIVLAMEWRDEATPPQPVA